MIYHRFGSPVKEIHQFDEESGEIVVSFEDDRPGSYPSKMHVSELKADGGINEIVGMAKRLIRQSAQAEGSETK